MTEKQLCQSAFRKLSVPERLVFSRPANTVLVAKIHGRISDSEIESSLRKILTKYPILATRFQLDKDGNVWLITTGLSKLPIAFLDERDGQQWLRVAEEEQRYVFNYETGPMIRFTLMRNGDKETLIVNCHHSICDGLSLCFLLSDLLHFVAEPDSALGTVSDPKLSADQVIPFKSAGIARRIGIGIYNRKWEKSGVLFSLPDYRKLFEEYWRRINGRNKIAVIDLQGDELEALIQNCRQNQITVNTALVTAMFAVMPEQSVPIKVGFPISIRERYSVKAERAFGWFVRGNSIEYRYDRTLGFWENAGKVQKIMEQKISDEEISRNSQAQMVRLISPFLIDSLSFAKEGLLNNPLSNNLLKKTGFSKISDITITNLGKIRIPETYGRLKIDAIYGPCEYADLTEKVVGVATINNKLTITLNYNEQNLDSREAAAFLETAISYLTCNRR